MGVMKGTFELGKPDELEATITLTAKVSEWKALKTQLEDKWPAYDLRGVLRDLIGQAEKVFWATGESK